MERKEYCDNKEILHQINNTRKIVFLNIYVFNDSKLIFINYIIKINLKILYMKRIFIIILIDKKI